MLRIFLNIKTKGIRTFFNFKAKGIHKYSE